MVNWFRSLGLNGNLLPPGLASAVLGRLMDRMPFLKAAFGLLEVDAGRQGNHPLEGAETPLHMVEILAFVLLLLLLFALMVRASSDKRTSTSFSSIPGSSTLTTYASHPHCTSMEGEKSPQAGLLEGGCIRPEKSCRRGGSSLSGYRRKMFRIAPFGDESLLSPQGRQQASSNHNPFLLSLVHRSYPSVLMAIFLALPFRLVENDLEDAVLLDSLDTVHVHLVAVGEWPSGNLPCRTPYRPGYSRRSGGPQRPRDV